MANKHFSDGSPIEVSALDSGGTPVVGTFTMSAAGFSAGPLTATARYVQVGSLVALSVPLFTGTSNATTLVLSGLPAGIRPSADRTYQCVLVKNQDNPLSGSMVIHSDGTVNVHVGFPTGAFNSNGVKLVGPCEIQYVI